MTAYRIRSTEETDYDGNLLPLAHQPHLSFDNVFNAWIEDDVVVFDSAGEAAAFVEIEADGGYVIEPAIGPARPPLDIVYIAIGLADLVPPTPGGDS